MLKIVLLKQKNKYILSDKNILIEKIEQNAFEEAIKLISLETEDKEVLNTLTILLSRVNRVKSNSRGQTRRSEDLDTELNNIGRSLLDIIHEQGIHVRAENREDSGEIPSTQQESKEENSSIQSTQKTNEGMFNKLQTNLVQVQLDPATKKKLGECHKQVCKIENDISDLEQGYHFISSIIRILVSLEAQLNETRKLLNSKGFQNSKIDYKSRELNGKIQNYLKEISEIKRKKKATEANEYIASFVIPYLEDDLNNYKSELT